MWERVWNVSHFFDESRRRTSGSTSAEGTRHFTRVPTFSSVRIFIQHECIIFQRELNIHICTSNSVRTYFSNYMSRFTHELNSAEYTTNWYNSNITGCLKKNPYYSTYLYSIFQNPYISIILIYSFIFSSSLEEFLTENSFFVSSVCGVLKDVW